MLAWFRSEIIGKWKNRKCSARHAHAWVISRQWDLRTASSNLHYVGFPRALGADARCQDCGAELLTFQRTGDVLRACRYLKGSDTERATSLRLKRDIEPLLTVCSSADVWLAAQIEHHDVHDVFDVKYVFEGQPIPEEYDDDADYS